MGDAAVVKCIFYGIGLLVFLIMAWVQNPDNPPGCGWMKELPREFTLSMRTFSARSVFDIKIDGQDSPGNYYKKAMSAFQTLRLVDSDETHIATLKTTGVFPTREYSIELCDSSQTAVWEVKRGWGTRQINIKKNGKIVAFSRNKWLDRTFTLLAADANEEDTENEVAVIATEYLWTCPRVWKVNAHGGELVIPPYVLGFLAVEKSVECFDR
eukprot:TRINITY_DN37205_c0_g1_i1.p1 TRINITY_DN37205_c0_g1~~TRINITY_DN37205_c0_g1_i1.p1  ORF type:complete len:212 (+),score=21.81 TRINITY_DN37205_c0_g1_i1:83-718(+)